jgi:hypothetical protein
MRGRTIWGVVVPRDSVWRTGANSATSLTTDADIVLGNVRVPKGSYTLYSVNGEKAFTLIISKKPAGRAEYDPAMDFARVEMKQSASPSPIDPFRIWLERSGKKGGILHLGWADRVYSLPVTEQ